MKVLGEDLPVNPGGRVRSVDINENAYTQRMVTQPMQCDDLCNIKSTCIRIKVSAVSQNIYIESKSCQVLTIETVRQKDFGTYACVVRNSLGEVVLIYILTYFFSSMKCEYSYTA